jgi:ADP-ribose pyrophosphatase YjhB (NUDIX family)
LKPRSFRPPRSVTRPTLNWLAAVAAVDVTGGAALCFFDPQPAASNASTTTSGANGIILFTGLSEVLDCGTKTVADSTSHTVVGVVLRVRDGRLEALIGSAPLRRGEQLDAALARAVDVSALAHVEQLVTRMLPDGELATAYLGLLPADSELAGDWRPAAGPGEHRELVAAAQARLRAKLSYTNVGYALAPATFTISELREVYVAALGHDVSSTNLQRVLVRRGVLERVEGRRAPGRSGGRPAALFRFASSRLEVTDEFAALRPPR